MKLPPFYWLAAAIASLGGLAIVISLSVILTSSSGSSDLYIEIGHALYRGIYYDTTDLNVWKRSAFLTTIHSLLPFAMHLLGVFTLPSLLTPQKHTLRRTTHGNPSLASSPPAQPAKRDLL